MIWYSTEDQPITISFQSHVTFILPSISWRFMFLRTAAFVSFNTSLLCSFWISNFSSSTNHFQKHYSSVVVSWYIYTLGGVNSMTNQSRFMCNLWLVLLPLTLCSRNLILYSIYQSNNMGSLAAVYFEVKTSSFLITIRYPTIWVECYK